MSLFKKTLMTIVMLLFTLALLSQESLGRYIWVEFRELNCQKNDEIVNFLLDYEQYQLTFALWLNYLCEEGHRCTVGILLYNSTTIDGEEILEILKKDDRVLRISFCNFGIRPRQLILKLDEMICEVEFINSYSDYGFSGSIEFFPGFSDKKLFSFNDTLIYPGDFIKLLRADQRVISANFIQSWADGSYTFSFVNHSEFILDDEKLEEFYKDYYYMEITGSVSFAWFSKIDFYNYDEFSVLNKLRDDMRIDRANFSVMDQRFFSLCEIPIVSSDIDLIKMIKTTSLISIYPNPFNPSTNIVFELTKNDNIRLDIYNLKGSHIINLANDIYSTGRHSIIWNGEDSNNIPVSSGIYFVKFKTSNVLETKKLLLIK